MQHVGVSASFCIVNSPPSCDRMKVNGMFAECIDLDAERPCKVSSINRHIAGSGSLARPKSRPCPLDLGCTQCRQQTDFKHTGGTGRRGVLITSSPVQLVLSA